VLVNPGLLNIPLAVSAQSVIFNLPSLKNASTPLKLTGNILAEMYSGQITMWNDPQIAAINGQLTLPPVKVVPLHRVEGSGDTFLFTSYLATQNASWDTGVGYGTLVNWPLIASFAPTSPVNKGVVGSQGMYTTCAQIVGCVGYNGVSYLQQEQGLGKAAMQNGAGHFSLPGPGTIQAELTRFIALTPPNETISLIAGTGGYPLINFEYAIVRSRQPSAAAAARIRAFLQWVITSPQATSLVTGPSINFQPLPADVRTLSLAQIGEIR
jgi:phosphate transport system substrate-binding protein